MTKLMLCSPSLIERPATLQFFHHRNLRGRKPCRSIFGGVGAAPKFAHVGQPRFELGYEDNVRMLAPFGLLSITDEDEFTRRYRERLDSHGGRRIRAVIAAIARREDREGVVLLCWENLDELVPPKSSGALA
jgi:hypothetical protein